MLPHFLWRMRKRGGYRKGFLERIFRLSEAQAKTLSDGRKLWVHAVSVGELQVGMAWMRAWRAEHPDTRFLLTVNTSTAHQIAAESLDPRDVLLYPPVDSPPVLRKLLDHVDLSALVLVETEMWPNLLHNLHRRGIPVILLNGRISDRSYRRLLRAPWLTRRIYPLVKLYLMQSEGDAKRARELGAPPEAVKVMHSNKYDVAERSPEEEESRRKRLETLGFLSDTATVLLGSSTWPGEEAALARIYMGTRKTHPNLRLILVPRHFERTHEVEADLHGLGLTWWRWSALPDRAPETPDPVADVLIVDTTGELKHFIGFADLVFIGKSLFRAEGQNPIEAANAGKAVVTGPGMANFKRVMEEMRTADAIREIETEDDLRALILQWLDHPETAAAQGERAETLVAARKGSIARSVHEIGELEGIIRIRRVATSDA
ncbi:MAG: hypothetical protein LAT83_04210 [Kiritimatiellae bacterium]|nr:hypothetical protein [Kiritimatiellia bacterium]